MKIFFLSAESVLPDVKIQDQVSNDKNVWN